MFLVERITRTGSVSVGNESRNWRTPIIFISLIGVGIVILQLDVERDTRHVYPNLLVVVPAVIDRDLREGGLTQRAILDHQDGSDVRDFDVPRARPDSHPGEDEGSVARREVDRRFRRLNSPDHFWTVGVARPLMVGVGGTLCGRSPFGFSGRLLFSTMSLLKVDGEPRPRLPVLSPIA